MRKDDDTRGDFDVFSEDNPWSTFDFVYKKEEFEILHDLVKFNTLINKQVRMLIFLSLML